MIVITKDIMQIAFPSASETTINKFIQPLNETIQKYKINIVYDICAFLAHVGHETGNLKRISENLNYSVDGLLKVFSKYFKTREEAQKYARQPIMIASRVYANRMGNGDEESGDGWKFRGRGLIQLTGKSNYQRFAKHVDMELEDVVSYLETAKGACISAGYYWSTHGCNGKTIIESTKVINGGTHGLEDRKQRHDRLLRNFSTAV